MDTAGCGCEEISVGEDIGKCNEGEAIIVSSLISSLVSAGVHESDIAVITPYNLQVVSIN